MEGLTIEACMRARQSVLVAIIPMNIEPAETVHTLKLAETVKRHFGCTGHELQKLGTFFLIE